MTNFGIKRSHNPTVSHTISTTSAYHSSNSRSTSSDYLGSTMHCDIGSYGNTKPDPKRYIDRGMMDAPGEGQSSRRWPSVCHIGFQWHIYEECSIGECGGHLVNNLFDASSLRSLCSGDRTTPLPTTILL